jgi:thiamine-phosphate pyrophosphorylase
MLPFPKRGLYAITQTENKSVETVFSDVESAIKGGAVVIQYREKNPADSFSLAGELARLCHKHSIPLIINDDVDLAIKINADGVHLGRNDSDLLAARQRLGSQAIIGVSCYNSIERALSAQINGATYVAFGRFFPSTTKPLAPPADIETLAKAKNTLRIPIVAIGGILPHNGGQLIQAGADLLAVISGIFGNDPEQSAQAYQHLFQHGD